VAPIYSTNPWHQTGRPDAEIFQKGAKPGGLGAEVPNGSPEAEYNVKLVYAF